MRVEDKLGKIKCLREEASRIEKDILDNPPEGTALEAAKQLDELLKRMISIMQISEEVDLAKAREQRPPDDYDIFIYRLEQEASEMERVAKVISNFVTLVNTGKIFDRNKETDMGIRLDTEELERALLKTAAAFKKDADTLKEV
jgi:hypothetical protein